MTNAKPSRMSQVPESEIALAQLGLGEVAYVRSLPARDVARLTGINIKIDPDQKLFCLYLADGTPVSVSDSRDAAIANAFEHDLATISVH